MKRTWQDAEVDIVAAGRSGAPIGPREHTENVVGSTGKDPAKDPPMKLGRQEAEEDDGTIRSSTGEEVSRTRSEAKWQEAEEGVTAEDSGARKKVPRRSSGEQAAEAKTRGPAEAGMPVMSAAHDSHEDTLPTNRRVRASPGEEDFNGGGNG